MPTLAQGTGLGQPNTPPATATPTPNPLGAIGNQVWNDLNSNGVQDSGEPYVQGVKVELLSGCSGTTILGTRTTDTNGYYNFPGLTAELTSRQPTRVPPAG